ncbi:hypothetical protein LCGC14_2474780 [marine sediment metagenome]|uniref:Uncharacterized protein n=1 Tax=marine sediment metagenome TaxID=412755 RepID=A0A0F9BX76_9ZZZZ
MMARIPARNHIVKSLPGTGVGVFGNSMSNDGVAFVGKTGTRTAGGPGLYPYYNKFTGLAASTAYTSALFALVQGDWYVYTVSIKKSAFDLDDVKWQNGTVFLATGGGNILDNNVADDTWVTIGGVCEFDGTSGNARFAFKTDSGSVPDVSLKMLQVVQFDTQGEATDYFNSRAFYDSESYEYSGLATLSGGTLAIVFATEGFQDQPDTNYGIQLTAHGSTHAYVSAQPVTGFTITGGTTDTVEWMVYRRDE